MQCLTGKEEIDFITTLLNESGLKKIKILRRLPGGSRSFAYQADHFVIRFPKTPAVFREMRREKKIIDELYPQISGEYRKKIHRLFIQTGEFPFSYLEKFSGKICDNRPKSHFTTSYKNLTDKQKKLLAHDLAEFFIVLHSLDVGDLKAAQKNKTVNEWDFTKQPDFKYDKIKKALAQYTDNQIDLDQYQIKTVTKKAFCHNDLSGSNMLITTSKKSILNGVIDFAKACITSSCNDFIPLYKLDRRLVVDTLTLYNKTATCPIEQQQTDYLILVYIGYCLYKTQLRKSAFLDNLLFSFLNKKSLEYSRL